MKTRLRDLIAKCDAIFENWYSTDHGRIQGPYQRVKMSGTHQVNATFQDLSAYGIADDPTNRELFREFCDKYQDDMVFSDTVYEWVLEDMHFALRDSDLQDLWSYQAPDGTYKTPTIEWGCYGRSGGQLVLTSFENWKLKNFREEVDYSPWGMEQAREKVQFLRDNEDYILSLYAFCKTVLWEIDANADYQHHLTYQAVKYIEDRLEELEHEHYCTQCHQKIG